MKKTVSIEDLERDSKILEIVSHVKTEEQKKSPWLISYIPERDSRLSYCSINPNYITFYKRRATQDDYENLSYLQLQNFKYENLPSVLTHNYNTENLKNHNPAGEASKKSNSRIKLAINWLHNLSNNQKVWCEELKKDVKFKLNFFTLTLPSYQIKSYIFKSGKEIFINDENPIFAALPCCIAKINYNYTDKYIKHELLNHFLTIMRRDYKIDSYIWRAETQANGNIHFHITTNKFIYLSDLRNEWNKVLAKTDMLDKYHEKFSVMNYQQYKQYRQKKGNPKPKNILKAYKFGITNKWYSPNSTDIHAVWKIKNMAAYLADYMTKKQTGRRLVEGCLWRLSELLSSFKKEVLHCEGPVMNELKILFKNSPNKVKIKDYVSIFCFSITDIANIIKDSAIVKAFVNYRDAVYKNYYKQLKISPG